MAVKRGLGKGLEALFAENSEDSGRVVNLHLSDIEPNRDQPRKYFNDDTLEELASSISQHGVIQPLIVRPFADGGYQLVAGERRWRAAHMAGLSEVPVVIREMGEREAAELALIENLQREDLNPMEEAYGFKSLIDEYSLTQEEVAKSVGKSRSAVANVLRLLSLPKNIAGFVEEGKISAGHARAILSFDDEEIQLETANLTIKNGLSVRDVEKMAKKAKRKEKKEESSKETTDSPFFRESFYEEVELALTEHLGRKVTVNESKKGGSLQVEFYSKDDLRMLANDIYANED